MNEHYSLVFKHSFSILIHVNWFNKKKAALVKGIIIGNLTLKSNFIIAASLVLTIK